MKRSALTLFFVLLLSFVAHAQTVQTSSVETVQFQSKLVAKTLPYSVVLPPSYKMAGETARRYSVLYLLHGLAGHYDNWLTKTKLKEYAARYQMIVVTPEGDDSWYTDSATVLTDKYESYVIQELIPDVESRYRTVKARKGRSIAGFSMGGYGALKFGIKYPELFIFAASISGALDVASRDDAHPGNAWSFIGPSIMQTFGTAGTKTRAENDLFKLFREFPESSVKPLPFFYLDCGTEDGFFSGSRALAEILLERKIPHEYRERPGTHNWAYWDAQVREVLRLAAELMTERAAPTSTSK